MKLIKKLGMRKFKTGINSNRWGLFLCPYCNMEVEKEFQHGKKAKSCGCKRIALTIESSRRAHKLNWDKVKEIRRKHSSGVKRKDLTEQYNISKSWLDRITSVRNWIPSTEEENAN